MRPRRIYLVGLSGSGKSTLGKSLAKRLSWEFVDTDTWIEKDSGRRIREMFSSEGEPAFRRIETAALREASRKERRVIATGGGMVLLAQNRRLMRSKGLVVALRLSPEKIAARLKAGETKARPLLSEGLKSLKRLARERAAYYRQAELQILANRPPEELCERLLRKIRTRMPWVLSDKTPR